jgi:uncharacterized RDD family membrane protein YckC
MRFAPLGPRIGSAAIDFVLLFLAAVMQFAIGFGIASATHRLVGAGFWIACSNLIVFAIIAWETRSARTMGKAATGLCVRRVDGNPASYRQLLGRTALKYLAPILFWMAFVPILLASEWLPVRATSDSVRFMVLATVVAIGLAAALNILGFLAAFSSPERRTLIDMITGTAVFIGSPEAGAPPHPTYAFPVIVVSAEPLRESRGDATTDTPHDGSSHP